MKKILAVIGSPNNEKSNTATMVRDFLEMVKEHENDVEWEVISLGTATVNPCRGCWACMKTGACVHGGDSLPEVRQKIRECDLLIIGSPVYEQQISAQLKALFDRTFMWLHLIGLMGKPVITAVTYGGDGRRPTERYLSGMMIMMGCIMVGHLSGIGKQPGVFPDRERCRDKYKPLARKVADILSGERTVRPSIINAVFFLFMKCHTRHLINLGEKQTETDASYSEYEHRYWKEKGWFHMSYRKALSREKSQ